MSLANIAACISRPCGLNTKTSASGYSTSWRIEAAADALGQQAGASARHQPMSVNIMKKELDEKLCHDYPGLYRHRHEDPQTTCMCRGFECADGWYELIDTVSALLVNHNPNITALQVKEKLAGLRFYHTHPDDYAQGVVNMADYLSLSICELCGAPGCKSNQGGWLSTRCEQHQRHEAGQYSKAATTDDLEPGWSGLSAILQTLAQWHTERNSMPAADFTINQDQDGLRIEFSGGDTDTQGMVDLVNQYSQKIDQYTGRIRS